MQQYYWTLALVLGLLTAAASLVPAAPARNDWYRNSLVNIHIDNHSGLLAQGVPAAEIVAAFKDVPVGMIQVSAQSNGYATYPTKVGLNNPQANGYDTLRTFRDATRTLGVKMCVYMSVDRRPLQLKDHPEWGMRDAADQIVVNGDPCVCNRPNDEKKGYLYEQFLPQIREIIAGYDPEGLWFDGDYILTRPCWCANCLKQWRKDTGQDAPRDESSPLWSKWNDWHYRRYQEYRRVVAETIHAASPKALYTSNWSWAWNAEPAPAWADTFSGDTGSIRQVPSAVMRWGAQQQVPWDIMTYAIPGSRTLSRNYSPQRILQEGGLTLAYGGNWFAWTFGGDLPPAGVDQARQMAQFVRARQAALGPSTSLSQVAVLDSETSWWQEGRPRTNPAVDSAARCLQEAGYLTDIVNEQTLRAGLVPYRLVVIPAGKALAPETLDWLSAFVRKGGALLACGETLTAGSPAITAAAEQLLGVKRTGHEPRQPAAVQFGERRCWALGSWTVAPTTAKTQVSFADGRPALTLGTFGSGRTAYLAADQVLYPGDEALLASVRALGFGPSYTVSGNGAAPVLCNLRARGGQVVLHLVNLSSRVGGRNADFNCEDFTDDNPYLRNVRVQLPCRGTLRLVEAVPALTGAQVSCENGTLTASVSYLQTHAALVLQPEGEVAFTPGDPATAGATGDYHPLDPQASGFFEDFEQVAVGAQPPAPWHAWSREQATVAVTDASAAGGTRSVLFTDTPGSSFWPFLHRSVTPFTQGKARLQFDLRVEGADCLMEVRYEGKGPGPQVRFAGDGKLFAGAKELMTYPQGRWLHAQVDFVLGQEKPSYTLTITVPGEQPRVFADLPYATDWFFLCDSVYFVGSGEQAGKFYLDNVRFERLAQ